MLDGADRVKELLASSDVLKAHGKPEIIRETQKKFRVLVEACGDTVL